MSQLELLDLAQTFPLASAVIERAIGPPPRGLATAESCTGGLVAAALTATPGSSAAFLGGVVAYANRAKEEILGVPPSLIAAHGAVSQEVALAMAEGARARFGSDLAVATTGVAGPAASEAKPAGLIFVAVAGPKATEVVRLDEDRGRRLNSLGAVNAALALLLRALD
ncbi:MAG TPA: CinA family protein [Candidatus Dormibacteraeota bacterium]